jgi:hypothetical protein
MFVKSVKFSTAELDRFRELQRRSFAILEGAGADLKEGATEREVAHQLVLKYREAGASDFFHLPVALFGGRTALPGDFTIRDFFPRKVALRDADSVILDASPIFDGFMVDTSYSFCCGENAAHRRMMKSLSQYRQSVLRAVNAGERFAAIAAAVEASMRAGGYEPVHAKHPGKVLGHRAVKRARLPFTWRIKGFDGLSLSWFILTSRAAEAGLRREDPLWNAGATSDHPPHDGLWLVEPHAGAGDVGAKWEEILVIENGRARWLDDEPPHVRQWRAIEAGDAYGPRSSALT